MKRFIVATLFMMFAYVANAIGFSPPGSQENVKYEKQFVSGIDVHFTANACQSIENESAISFTNYSAQAGVYLERKDHLDADKPVMVNMQSSYNICYNQDSQRIIRGKFRLCDLFATYTKSKTTSAFTRHWYVHRK